MVTSNLGSTDGEVKGGGVVPPSTRTWVAGWPQHTAHGDVPRHGSLPPYSSRPWSPHTVFLHTEGASPSLHLNGVRAQGWLRSQREGQVHNALPWAHVSPLRDAVPSGVLLTRTRGVGPRFPGHPGEPNQHPRVRFPLSQPCHIPMPAPPRSLPAPPRLTFRNTRGSWKARRRWLQGKFKVFLRFSPGWGHL